MRTYKISKENIEWQVEHSECRSTIKGNLMVCEDHDVWTFLDEDEDYDEDE